MAAEGQLKKNLIRTKQKFTLSDSSFNFPKASQQGDTEVADGTMEVPVPKTELRN